MSSRKELVENSLTAIDNIQYILLRLKNDIEQIEQAVIENKETPVPARKDAFDYSFTIIELCVIVKQSMDELAFRR